MDLMMDLTVSNIEPTAQNILNDIIEIIENNTESASNLELNEDDAIVHDDDDDHNSLAELDEYYQHIAIDNDDSDDCLDDLLKQNVHCDACKMKESLFWRRVTRRLIVCNECFYEKAYLILFDDENMKKKSAALLEDSRKEAKRKKPKLSNNKKSDSNRPVTRTNQNGSKKHQNGFSTQLSSSSTSTKSEATVVEDVEQKEASLTESNKTTLNLRKSARISKSKPKTGEENSETMAVGSDEIQSKVATSETTNRRTKIFKKATKQPIPIRCETTFVSKLFTQDLVCHRGFYMKIGDIVALTEQTKNAHEDEDNLIYFAQIRAFLCDQFGKKSAIITWLIPINDEHKKIRLLKDFDPSFFVLGPAEEFPRSLDSMEFVCRPDELASEMMTGDKKGSFDYLNQYRNDLLRHKFELENLAAANFRIVTKKTYNNVNACENKGHHENVKIEHEFKWE